MQCEFPQHKEYRPGQTYSHRCGGCLPCKLTSAATWTLRLLLEASAHKSSIFITLTYGPESLPEKASLSKRDWQLFLKRLRMLASTTLSPEKSRVRFYANGEYGPRSERPHYHAVLFGLGIESSNLVEKAWSKGFITATELTPERAAYQTGYSTKKNLWLQKPQDGRESEFRLMSRKPGLGQGTLLAVGETMLKHKERLTGNTNGSIPLGEGLESYWTHGVPESIRFHGRLYPLGSYLQDELISLLGIPGRDTARWQTLSSLEHRSTMANPIELSVEKRLKAKGKAEQILRHREMKAQI